MRNFLLFIVGIFVLSSQAVACDIKKSSFGSSIEQVMSVYNVEALAIEKEGEFILSEMGDIACSGLPEISMIEFTFIDNVFVKIQIKNPSSGNELFKYAKSALGKNDDASRKPDKDGRVLNALWNNDSRFSAVYIASKNEESLDISSKMHKALFGKITQQKNKALDAYLKENGKGKYASDNKYKSNTIAPKTTNGDYDADALKKMKDSFEKSSEKWKNDNSNNPKSGR